MLRESQTHVKFIVCDTMRNIDSKIFSIIPLKTCVLSERTKHVIYYLHTQNEIGYYEYNSIDECKKDTEISDKLIFTSFPSTCAFNNFGVRIEVLKGIPSTREFNELNNGYIEAYFMNADCSDAALSGYTYIPFNECLHDFSDGYVLLDRDDFRLVYDRTAQKMMKLAYGLSDDGSCSGESIQTSEQQLFQSEACFNQSERRIAQGSGLYFSQIGISTIRTSVMPLTQNDDPLTIGLGVGLGLACLLLLITHMIRRPQSDPLATECVNTTECWNTSMPLMFQISFSRDNSSMVEQVDGEEERMSSPQNGSCVDSLGVSEKSTVKLAEEDGIIS